MKKYSEFINFPIYLWATKEIDVEVPADEDESTEEDETCMHLIFNICSFLLISLFLSFWVHGHRTQIRAYAAVVNFHINNC